MKRTGKLLFALLALSWVAPLQAAGVPKLDRVMVVEPARSIADFTLLDQDGKPRKFSSFRGEPLLVFFGFTHCPDVCPTTLHQLQLVTAMRQPDMRGVKVLLISVDPARDSPARLKQYLANFTMPYLQLFYAMTGKPAELQAVAQSFGAAFFKREPQIAALGYSFDHTSQVFLVDGSGKLRAEFYNALPQVMAQAAAAVRVPQATSAPRK